MRPGTLEGTDVRHMQAALMHLAHGTSTVLIILGLAVKTLAVASRGLAYGVPCE